jgi:hypothetical protein
MKNILLLAAALLAVAGLAPAHAQNTVSTSSGDLILAFRTNDNAIQEDLEVDLGPYSDFTNLAAGTVLNLNLNGSFYGVNGGLAAADLGTVFGNNWDTLTDLVWSVAGQNDPTGAASTDLYVTFTPADGATVSQKSGSTQRTAGARLVNIQEGLSGVLSLSSTEAGELASNAASQANYSGAIRGNGTVNKDYGYFTPSTEALYSDSSSSSLDLFSLIHGGTGAGSDLGTFTLDSAGDFSFTAAGAVPEPSTYAALALGGAALLLVRRRRAT